MRTIASLHTSADSGPPVRSGALIVNADDWGRDRQTTAAILECCRRGTVSSVSAMVFMADSERAAAIALKDRIEAGLHLNLTTAISGAGVPAELEMHREKVGRYLLRHRLAQAVFHPGLKRSFEYLVKAQMEEFQRLYGEPPQKIDGHHHMHLAANILAQRLLPAGTIVRRNFSFDRGEKSVLNRVYRKAVDGRLARRHRMADLFFSLPPMETRRLEHIYTFAREHVVELETHPVQPEEYRYLAGGEIFRDTGDIPIRPAKAALEARRPVEKSL